MGSCDEGYNLILGRMGNGGNVLVQHFSISQNVSCLSEHKLHYLSYDYLPSTHSLILDQSKILSGKEEREIKLYLYQE